ncbi:MAG: RnfABCDGE type electron transport complex subunit D [Candidatus Competibacteraceae bacterium]
MGGLFAAIVGKQTFGGIGQNVFNPAMLARIALLVSFPVEMTCGWNRKLLFSAQAPGFWDGSSDYLYRFFGRARQRQRRFNSRPYQNRISPRAGAGTDSEGHYQPLRTGLGAVPGSLGETSALLLIIGGIWLLLQRLVTWHIPVALLGTVALLAGVFLLVRSPAVCRPIAARVVG